MSESSHLHKNTFLSRVFAATSKGSQHPPPLLKDDSIFYSDNNNDTDKNNELEFEPELDGSTPDATSRKRYPSNVLRSHNIKETPGVGTPDISSPNKPRYQSKLTINVQSESESESESDGDLDEENANYSSNHTQLQEGPIRLRDSASPPPPMNENKRNLLRQLESELGVDDNDNDDYTDFLNYNKGANDSSAHNEFPESILLEEGGMRATSNRIHNNGRRQPGLLKKLEQSFIDQIKTNDLPQNLNEMGERAKQMANKAMNQIPSSFNMDSSMLQPPPNFLSYKGNSVSKGVDRGNNGNNDTVESINRKIFNARKLPPNERAMWMWANVTNLDVFLQDVYDYYLGNGWYCIALQRASDLLIVVFVIWLSSFMNFCIDYTALLNGNASKFNDVYINQCFAKTSFLQKFFFTILGVILTLRVKHTWEELCDLSEIQLFYKYLLNIDDKELQTISWPQIVKRIMVLKDQHANAIFAAADHINIGNGSEIAKDLKSKSRLNAHDIANRLMRKENYMIALFNKNILNKALTIPLFNTYFLTKTLEWNLNLCITDYMFTQDGQLKQAILNQHNRLTLANGLRKRFRIAGLLSIVLTPFLVVYFVLYFFLKFFYDFKTNPGLLNSREYSPYAKWRMREFNELPHLFDGRLKLSVEGADEYLDQFPKEKSNIIMKFFTFISGSLVTVLVILTIFDHENFLNFELSEGRTVLFYISTLGAIFTICKNNVSSSNYVFDPEASLKYVSQFTHYLPQAWEGRYHSVEIKNQFCQLYNLKIVLIGKEICSLIFLPWMLYVSLPSCSERLIDFFRDFSVHVDGLGYVCSFATFKMDQEVERDKIFGGADTTGVKRHQNSRLKLGKNLEHLKKINKQSDLENGKSIINEDLEDIADDEYYASNNDKMVKSYMYFLESYGGKDGDSQPNFKKHSDFNESIKGHYPKRASADNNFLRKSVLRNAYFDKMEETNAGLLSNDTEEYLNGLTKSIMLGEDFQNRYEHDNTNYKTKEEDDDTGVIGLLNKIYHHKDKGRDRV